MSSLLTVAEVAKKIKCSRSTIYAWAESGKIPVVKINGMLRFNSTIIDNMINKNYETLAKSHAILPEHGFSGGNIKKIIKASIASVRKNQYNTDAIRETAAIKPGKKGE